MLVVESLPLLDPFNLWAALTSARWRPTAGQFGLLPMLAGTLLVSAFAMVIAAPLGVLYSVWLNLYLPRRRAAVLRGIQELFAGIPSVVYGLWGLMVLVPLVNIYAPPGASLFSAILVLALMILPFSALVSDAALQEPVKRHLSGGDALALSRWGTFRHVLWPEARSTIVAGIVLQFGRALGETMAVMMVAGNVVQIPHSLFDPIRTLTANIALEMSYATGTHQTALFMSGLVLLAVTLLLMLPVHRTHEVSP